MLLGDISGKTMIQPNAFVSNLFFRFFLTLTCMNTSCYECQLRNDGCSADVRIADFWGTKYAERDDGVNLVIVNTKKGKDVWNNIKHRFIVEECSFEDLLQSKGVRYHKENKRDITLAELRDNNITLENIYNRHHRPSLLVRVLKFNGKVLGYIAKSMLGKQLFNKIKEKILWKNVK
jgi:hypothetical protein